MKQFHYTLSALCFMFLFLASNAEAQAPTGFEDFTKGNWTLRSTPPTVSTPAGVTIGSNGLQFTSEAVATFQISNVIYVLAPYYSYTAPGVADKRINRLFAYNISTNTWTEKARFPFFTNGIYHPFFSFSANGIGYVGSGYSNFTGNGTSNNPVNNLYSYNPSCDCWTAKGGLPVVYNGGTSENCFAFSTDEANSTTQTSGTILINDRAFVGFSYGRFYEYVPTNNTWIQKSTFPDSTQFASQATYTKYFSNGGSSIESSGFIYGGYNGSKFANKMWEYSLSSNAWTFVGVSPYDSSSANTITATERRVCIWTGSDMTVFDPQTHNWLKTNAGYGSNSAINDKIMGGQYFWKGQVFFLHSDITSPYFFVFDASKAIEDITNFKQIYCKGDSMFIPVKAEWVDCNGGVSIVVKAMMNINDPYSHSNEIELGKLTLSNNNFGCYKSVNTFISTKIPDGYTASNTSISLVLVDTTNSTSNISYYAGNNVYSTATITNDYYGNGFPINIKQNLHLPIAGQHTYIKGQTEMQFSTYGSFLSYGDLHWQYPNEFDTITGAAYFSPNNSESFSHQFTNNSTSNTLTLNGNNRFYDNASNQYNYCKTDTTYFTIQIADTMQHSFGKWQLDGNTASTNNRRTVGGVAAVLNGKIYFGNGGEETSSGSTIFYTAYNDWHVYDPITKTTTDLPNKPFGSNIIQYQYVQPTHHTFSFVIGDYIYVGGGLTTNNIPSNLFFRYDAANNKWDRMADLPIAVYGANSYSINDKGYVVFGQTSATNLNDVTYRYDAINDQWYSYGSTGLPTRYNATSFTLGDKAYIVGGINSNGDSLSDVIEMNSYGSFNPKNNFPFGNIAAANGFSILNAGYIVPAFGNATYRYYNSSDTWEVDDTIPLFDPTVPRHELLAIASSNNAAYALEEDNTNNYELVWKFIADGSVPDTINITSDQTTVCTNTQVTFTATTNNTTTHTYQWKLNGNNVGTNDSTLTINITSATDSVSCDLIVNSNVTASSNSIGLVVNYPTSSTTTVSVCSNHLPFNWNGVDFYTSSNYAQLFTNANGCDSTATLVLTVQQITSSSTNIFVCSNQLPYLWNGINRTTAGTYTKTLVNAVGCDSIATLILTVKQTSSSTTKDSILSGSSYSFNGSSYSSSGTYTKTLVNAVGCDSIATLILTVKTGVAATITGNLVGCSFVTTNTLRASIVGGSWRSTNQNIATINQFGVVTAITNGTTTIAYTYNKNGQNIVSTVTYTVAVVSALNPITGVATFCRNATTLFSNNTTIPAGGNGVWSTPSSSLISINATTGVATGVYQGMASIQYKIINSNGCSNAVSYSVIVKPIPNLPTVQYAPGTVNPQTGPGGSFCANKIFTVVGNPANGIWSSTGVITIGASTGVINTGTIAGAASVIYTINVSGCVNSKIVDITVAVCPSHRGSATEEIMNSSKKFTIYPNPAKGMVNLQIDKLIGAGSIMITDLYGKQVKMQALSMGNNSVDISNFSKGFYLISVITSDGKTTKKLVVE